MDSKLVYKTKLRYFLDNKQVVFYNEFCSDGLATTGISIGNDEIKETTICGRVLSGKCSIDGTTCGYTYVYDEEGTTIDLKPLNENISVTDSVNKIDKVKNSKDFYKARMNGLLVITNSPEFVFVPNKNFTIYKEISLKDSKNTLLYSLQQNYTCDDKLAKMTNEEDKYQVNNENMSVTLNSKDTITDELDSSFIETLKILKELLYSSPKNYKNLLIEPVLNSTKKTIR